MSFQPRLFAAVLLSLFLPNIAAHADTLEYNFSGSDVNGSFVINTGITPRNSANGFFDEAITAGSGTFAGITDVFFITNPGTTYIGDLQAYVVQFNGVELFSGPESSPAYLTGIFHLTNYSTGAPVTLDVVVTPEPSSLVLLGTGALGLLCAGRRRLFHA